LATKAAAIAAPAVSCDWPSKHDEAPRRELAVVRHRDAIVSRVSRSAGDGPGLISSAGLSERRVCSNAIEGGEGLQGSCID